MHSEKNDIESQCTRAIVAETRDNNTSVFFPNLNVIRIRKEIKDLNFPILKYIGVYQNILEYISLLNKNNFWKKTYQNKYNEKKKK